MQSMKIYGFSVIQQKQKRFTITHATCTDVIDSIFIRDMKTFSYQIKFVTFPFKNISTNINNI